MSYFISDPYQLMDVSDGVSLSNGTWYVAKSLVYGEILDKQLGP